jgi:hypothetical protein
MIPYALKQLFIACVRLLILVYLPLMISFFFLAGALSTIQIQLPIFSGCISLSKSREKKNIVIDGSTVTLHKYRITLL